MMDKKIAMSFANTANVLTLLAIGIVMSFGVTTEAAHVLKIKDKKALVEVDDASETFVEGDLYFVMADGKKRALIKITQAKGNRAIAEVQKGTVTVGATLQAARKRDKPAAATAQASKPVKEETAPSTPPAKKNSNGIRVGVLGGLNSTSQTVQAPINSVSQSVAMTGMGYSLMGTAELPFTDSLNMYIRAGAEQFSVTGSSSVGTKTTDLLYLAGSVLGRYVLTKGKYTPLLQAGLGLHYPISKSSNILNASQISATTIFFGGAALQYYLDSGNDIEVSVEYAYFPPSSDVTTSSIIVRAGYAWPY